MVSQYNHFMDGVDRMDQNIDNYRMGVRSKSAGDLFLSLHLMPVFATRGGCTGRQKTTVLLIIWGLSDA